MTTIEASHSSIFAAMTRSQRSPVIIFSVEPYGYAGRGQILRQLMDVGAVEVIVPIADEHVAAHAGTIPLDVTRGTGAVVKNCVIWRDVDRFSRISLPHTAANDRRWM
jgi:hypothetical protein